MPPLVTTSPGDAADDVLDRRWELAPGVAVRPESFGALLYSFTTRRLSFLKERLLLDVVRALPAADSARAACADAGVTDAQLPAYGRALATLVRTDMLQERP